MEITSVSEYVDKILKRKLNSEYVTTYRGHADKSFKLIPSIFREEKYRNSEHILLRELVASHPDDFASDATALEMLVRMQHYSLPTRLLDVSLNPLVALYFACEVARKRETLLRNGKRVNRQVAQDGEVVIMSVHKEWIRYFDSDTVACLANLARLKHELKLEIDPTMQPEEFNETLPIKRLIHFIRQEKSGFSPEIWPGDLRRILLVKPKQNNRRILAQSGAFFVFGLREELAASILSGVRVSRIVIDKDSKEKIRGELDKLGFNEKTLFPEIESAARYIAKSVDLDFDLTDLM